MAHSFRIDTHPLWQRLLLQQQAGEAMRSLRHKYLAVIDSVMYGRDPETQYLQLAEARTSRMVLKQRQQRQRLAWEQQFGLAPGLKGAVTRHSALDHARRKLVPGRLYSIPLTTAATPLIPLTVASSAPFAKRQCLDEHWFPVLVRDEEDLLQPPPPVHEVEADQVPALDSLELQQWAASQLFFRVGRTQLSRAKVFLSQL